MEMIASPLSAIVAVAQNGTIGRDNALPWKLRTDLQRFKRLTMGHTLLMGRKTYESIGRPLPGRHTIVLSRTPSLEIPNVQTATSIEQALAIAPHGSKVFVVGGAEVYRQAWPMVTEIFITHVLADIEGDAWLPKWEMNQFDCIETSLHEADEFNEWPTRFEHWVAKS